MTAANRPSFVHPTLADVALGDASTCAATGGMSKSWWLEQVRLRNAPQPAIRQARFTRWLLSDVRHFWQQRIADAAQAIERADAVTVKAKHASAKARTPEAIAKAKATRARNIAARIQPAAQ